VTRPQSGISIQNNYNVLIALILLSSLLPVQYIGGYSIIDPMSNTLAITTANAESSLFITFGLGLTLGEFFIGPLADKYGRLPIAVICLNLYAISSLICAVHYSPMWFLAFRMVSGFTVAAGVIIARTIISDNLPLREGASMLSQVTMYSSLLVAIYPLVIQYAISYFHLSWLSFFVFNAIFCAIVSIQAFLMLNQIRTQKLNPDSLKIKTLKQGFKHTLATRQYQLPLLAFLMTVVIVKLFSFTLPIISKILHGTTTLMLLTAGLGAGISASIMLLINKTLINRGFTITSITGGLLTAIAILGVGIVVLFQLPLSDATHYYIFLFLYLIICGLLTACSTNLFMVCSESFDKQKVNAGFITSLTISLSGFISFITSLLLPALDGMTTQSISFIIISSILICLAYFLTQCKKLENCTEK